MPNLNLKEQIEDVQGIIVRGYSQLQDACYVLLEIDDPQAARQWLGTLSVTDGRSGSRDRALNVAFTHAGLAALGLDRDSLRTFSHEFREGMVSPYRSRILGDQGASDPEHWEWGGPQTAPVHILLMLYASTEAALADYYEEVARQFEAAGLREQKKLDAALLRGENGCSKEHFGFCDGISQPYIEGLEKPAPAEQTVATGEFILGYPNEYGKLTERPLVPREKDPDNLLPDDVEGSGRRDLGRNGTYLVFRQMSQDVKKFWTFIQEQARDEKSGADADAPIRLASKMVGRWPSGAPMVRAPDHDDPDLARENDFRYHDEDPSGHRCPIGSHIRRTNPRDDLGPDPGSEQSIETNKLHQILRRGRAYGTPVADSMDPRDIMDADASGERGLHFICLAANLRRQFEFLQHSWANNPKFNGLYDDPDPLIGDRHRSGTDRPNCFTEQGQPVRRRITGMPNFVTIRGGEYFFLPSLQAIRYLASL